MISRKLSVWVGNALCDDNDYINDLFDARELFLLSIFSLIVASFAVTRSVQFDYENKIEQVYYADIDVTSPLILLSSYSFLCSYLSFSYISMCCILNKRKIAWTINYNKKSEKILKFIVNHYATYTNTIEVILK